MQRFAFGFFNDNCATLDVKLSARVRLLQFFFFFFRKSSFADYIIRYKLGYIVSALFLLTFDIPSTRDRHQDTSAVRQVHLIAVSCSQNQHCLITMTRRCNASSSNNTKLAREDVPRQSLSLEMHIIFYANYHHVLTLSHTYIYIYSRYKFQHT